MSRPARPLSVRLQGFKSFAERTHVAFGPGISAVVGPNGSGKSNLADALRWALGEQGRALRSRKAEDVIWAGSERRAALGMADVQLVLDNADGLLPVEYGVVELGRRLYRSGENDYLLNRQRVRLRDLVDLLDAGHLAENAFLFIGQGMVDQALALRPEERRPLFEEVAGVRRHERRRRRASLPSMVPLRSSASIAICFARHGVEVEACSDFRDAAGALGNDDEIYDHQDDEDDDADDEIAAHHEIAERLDDVASGVGALVAVRQYEARGGQVERQPQHSGDQQHSRKRGKFEWCVDEQRGHQDQHRDDDRDREREIEQDRRQRQDQHDQDGEHADRECDVAALHERAHLTEAG